MRCALLLLLNIVPSTGLLGSWTAARYRFATNRARAQRFCASAVSEMRGMASGGNESPNSLVGELLELFQGDFDNYDQVIEDREAGMLPGPGGGHEHIHCSLKPLDPALVPEQVAAATLGNGFFSDAEEGGEGEGCGTGRDTRPLAVVAAKYYFNGDSNVVFRYRLYSFHPCPPNAQGARGDAIMRLWRLLPPVEARLRAKGYDLEAFDWCAENEPRQREEQQQQEDQQNQDQPGHEASRDRPSRASGSERDAPAVAERISGCDIFWSRYSGDGHGDQTGNVPGGFSSAGKGDAVEGGRGATGKSSGVGAAAATPPSPPTPGPDGPSFVGLMGEDDRGTWVQSQNVDGLEILVKDDLRLWANQLWVNDRGFDREGKFVYGNQRNVPYKMRRVVAAGPLKWTLGERHRTKEAYEEKMFAIGVTPGQRFGPPARGAATAPARAGG